MAFDPPWRPSSPEDMRAMMVADFGADPADTRRDLVDGLAPPTAAPFRRQVEPGGGRAGVGPVQLPGSRAYTPLVRA